MKLKHARAFSIFALLLMATLINSRPAISQELTVERSTTTMPTPAVEIVEAPPQPACTPPAETRAGVVPEATRTTLTVADFLESRNAVAPPETRTKAFVKHVPVFSKVADAQPHAGEEEQQTGTGGGGGGVGSGTPPTAARTPLTSEEKMERAFRSAFLSPAGYIMTGIGSTITEATETDLPHKSTEDRFADGLSRFAINFGTRSARILLGSGVYPSLFKQDPRYRRSDKKDVGSRTLHAISRVFVADGDNGRLQPNYSRLAGNLSAAALANIWEQNTPGRERIGGRPTLRRFTRSLGFDALNFVIFREFWPDIMRKLGRK